MRIKLVALAVALCGTCLLALNAVYWKGGRAHRQPASPEPKPVSQVPDLEDRVRRLETTQFGLGAAVAAAAKPAASAEPAQSEPPSPPVSEEDQRRAADAQVRAQLDLLHQTFAREPRDPAWSESAQQQLLAAYRNEAFAGLEVVAADCKRTICRVDLKFSSAAEIPRLAQLVPMKAPWSGKGFSRIDPATGSGVFFLARPEHDLPRPTMD